MEGESRFSFDYEGDGALEIMEGDPRDWDDPTPAWEDSGDEMTGITP